MGESASVAPRETGEIEPRQQTVFKKHTLAGQEERLRALVDAQPDRTLAELREALLSGGQPVLGLARPGSARMNGQKNGTRRRTASPDVVAERRTP